MGYEIFVDDMLTPATVRDNGRRLNRRWSHLTVLPWTEEAIQALHDFATRIGLQRGWFQPKTLPHYDVTESMRDRALQAGASAIGTLDLMRMAKSYMKERGGWFDSVGTEDAPAESVSEATPVWRCFHCGFETSDRTAAEAHFGSSAYDAWDSGPAALCGWWHSVGDEHGAKALQDAQAELAAAQREAGEQDAMIARLRAEVEELQKKVSDLDHDNTRMIDAGFFELIMGPSVDLMTGEPIPTTVLPPDGYYDFCRDDPKAAAERIYQLETLVRGLRKHPTAAREGE
jgi:hypothetical protein